MVLSCTGPTQGLRLQRSKSYVSCAAAPTVVACTSVSDNGNEPLQGITVSNLRDGESLSYSLALVRGRVPKSCARVRVRCRPAGASKRSQQPWSEWPAHEGSFRLLAELQRGRNELELEAGGCRSQLELTYEPRQTTLRVTPVYVVCAGHDGFFQGPRGENRSPESAATRIGLGARLLQCLTAEKMQEAGHGRKTFQLERDLDGAECLVLQSRLHVDKARAMSQRELWELVARELMTGPVASKDRKYLAFLSCTRYRGAPSPRTHEDTLARTQAHVALGGGGLALFGSACLHTWPTCMSQVVPRLLDRTPVDTQRLMDDSNYRGTHGGCLATTLGSALHELGHTFGLGHTRDGIMGRGFDHVDRVFLGAAAGCGVDANRNSTLRQEPQHTTVALSRPLSVTVTVRQLPETAAPRLRLLSESAGRPSVGGRRSAPASPDLGSCSAGSFGKLFGSDSPARTDRTFWGGSCAAMLAYHRWFNPDSGDRRSRNVNDLQYDAKRNMARSRHGIRVIELRESAGGLVVASRQFVSSQHSPTEAMVPAVPPHCTTALTLVAEDSLGNILKYPLPTSF